MLRQGANFYIKMENDIIDYGKWSVPTSWNDISLEQFEKIEKYYAEKSERFDVRDVIEVFVDKTRDEVNSLPSDFLEFILEKMQFLQEEIPNSEPSNKISIDGEEYMINFMEKLKVGEYVDVDTSMKNDPYDYGSFFAILCRKSGEKYDSDFIAMEFENRKKMFERQPITKIMPLIQFFFHLYTILETPSLLSMKAQEALNSIQANIETLEKDGVFSRLYTRSLMRKLKKLRKSIKNI